MRRRILFVAFLSVTSLIATSVGSIAQSPSAPAQAPPAKARPVPVVVELFTSEGCSSCPPADDVLAMLAKDQPVPGAQIIALGEHVDYWDRLGWRDRFSSAEFTARQNEYRMRVFHTDSIYTPQMIVNGAQEVVGSDAKKVKQAIAKAAQRPPVVTLSLAFAGDRPTKDAVPAQISVQVQASAVAGAKLDGPTDVLLAITEEGLGSHVLKGENSGRDLHHGTVLRALVPIGTFGAGDGSWSTTKSFSLPGDWNARQVHIVALAQAQQSQRILGATITPLAADAAAPTAASK